MSGQPASTTNGENAGTSDAKTPQPTSETLTLSRGNDRSNPFAGFLMPFLVSALLVARLLVPAESGARGDTLWITQLWFVVGLIWSLLRIQRRCRFSRPGLLDVAVGLIVLGHVVSAVVVMNGAGDKRAACNMLWEWLALGVSFVLLKQMLLVDRHRRQLTVGMLSLMFCLSGFGLWQHFVFYKQAGDEYASTRGELDQLIETQAQQPDPGRMLRIRELRQLLEGQGVPLAGQNRILFEQRLQSSTEPFGPFALANTFAALLVGWLVVLLLGVMLRRDRDMSGLVMAVILFSGIAWCLLLTKSRAAYAGAVVGCICGLALSWAGIKRRTWISVVGLFGIVGAIAVLGNGLDREVISEAPKSLKYRLEYWAGSLEVVKASPVFGSGPGNFRQHYLRHKLPESSEEISDPHNLILDAWSNGGLIALVGLVLLSLCLIGLLTRTDSGRNGVSPPALIVSALRDPVSLGMMCGFVLVVLWDWFNGQLVDSRNLYLLGAFLMTALVSTRMLADISVPSNVYAAAAVSIMVCLLAAGGFGMPAIFQCVLVLAVLSLNLNVSRAVETPVRSSSAALNQAEALASFALPALGLGLVLVCLQTAIAPVVQSRLSTRLGKQSLQTGRIDLGLRHLQRAVEFDSMSPGGYSELASVQFGLWVRSGGVSTDMIDKAVSNYKISVDNDPLNPSRRAALARCLRSSGDVGNLKQAVVEMAKAVELYPNSSEFVSENAMTLFEAGDSGSAAAARRALELDAMNHQMGHRDRYLADSIVDQLESIEAANDSLDHE